MAAGCWEGVTLRAMLRLWVALSLLVTSAVLAGCDFLGGNSGSCPQPKGFHCTSPSLVNAVYMSKTMGDAGATRSTNDDAANTEAGDSCPTAEALNLAGIRAFEINLRGTRIGEGPESGRPDDLCCYSINITCE
jgi:hypothetical protein